jgi:hypothetical protein
MAVATGTALAIGAGAGLAGSSMQARAARKAADTQAAAADRAMAQEMAMYEQSREDLAPYRELGYTALGDIESRIPFFTSQFGDEQLAQYLDPSMDFRRRLGEQTTARMLNVGGGAISGNTLRGLEDYGQNLASTEYGNAFNRFQNERTNIYNTLGEYCRHGARGSQHRRNSRPELCRKSDWAYYGPSGCASCGRSWSGQCLLGRSRECRKHGFS